MAERRNCARVARLFERLQHICACAPEVFDGLFQGHKLGVQNFKLSVCQPHKFAVLRGRSFGFVDQKPLSDLFQTEAPATSAQNERHADNLARLALAEGRLELAERCWRVCLDDELDPKTLVQLGSVVAARGELKEATRLLELATELAPESAKAWTQLGVVRFSRHDFGSATDALRRALALHPASRSARRHLYLACLARGDQPAAEQELRVLCALHPEDPSSAIDLAIVELDRGDAAAAAARLQTVADAEPDNRRAVFYLALAKREAGEEAKAVTLLKTLLEGSDRYAGRAAEALAAAA